MEQNNKSFTNEVSEKFWGLYGIMKSVSIILCVIMIAIAIYLKSLTFLFVGMITVSITLLWTILFYGASEIIEKLQIIEDNIKK